LLDGHRVRSALEIIVTLSTARGNCSSVASRSSTKQFRDNPRLGRDTITAASLFAG
jgi:hypothetical protein